MEALQSYRLPEGWRVYLPEDFMPDPEAEPPVWRFFREAGDFSVYFTAWAFSQGSNPADPARLLEIFGDAAQGSALREADLSSYGPEDLAVTAWQGLNREGIRMTVLAFAAPGRMLAAYLVGNSLLKREELLGCLRKTVREDP